MVKEESLKLLDIFPQGTRKVEAPLPAALTVTLGCSRKSEMADSQMLASHIRVHLTQIRNFK